jgi:hypothetical protein
MSHLEDLIAEYYDWQGYVVKRNIRVGKLVHSCIFAILLAIVSGTDWAQTEDPFPLTTIKGFLRQVEWPEDENQLFLDPRGLGLKVVLEYHGELNPIRDDMRRTVHLFLKGVQQESLAELFF